MGYQQAIDEALNNIGGTWGLAARLRLLVVAIAVLVMTASLSVVLGVEQPTHLTQRDHRPANAGRAGAMSDAKPGVRPERHRITPDAEGSEGHK